MDDLHLVLPVFNEKKHIEHVLQEWQYELKALSISYRFIVCEEGSTDGTSELLKRLKKPFNLILNQKKIRRGYGKAVIDGIKTARANFILCVDSDGQCDPKDFMSFWKKRESADILIGKRIKRADYFYRKLFSWLFKGIFVILFTTKIQDPSCPFVLFKKKTIARGLKYLHYLSEGFWWGFSGFCLKNNLSINQIPINHRKRYGGDTQVFKFNKLFSISLKNVIGLIKLKMTRLDNISQNK